MGCRSKGAHTKPPQSCETASRLLLMRSSLTPRHTALSITARYQTARRCKRSCISCLYSILSFAGRKEASKTGNINSFIYSSACRGIVGESGIPLTEMYSASYLKWQPSGASVSTPQKISFMYILALFIAVQFSMGAKPRQKDTTPGSPYPSAPQFYRVPVHAQNAAPHRFSQQVQLV